MRKSHIITALSINLLVLTVAYVNLLENISVGANIKSAYEEMLNYTYNNYDVKNNVSDEYSVIKETYTQNTNNKSTKDKNNRNLINSGDNPEVGIVITNTSENIHHDDLTIKSNSDIYIYYGEGLKNKKNCGRSISINSGDDYFKSNNIIKICSAGKLKVSDITDAALEGELHIYSESSGLVAVNRINVEKYLYGVVASEMPESFEKEALKAQAVCARTYTYAHLDNDKYKQYNAIMDNTTSYQAYGNSEYSKKIMQAVNETKGEVLSVNNELIDAYYFSTSCGYTTDYKIWGDTKLSYLKSKYVSKNEGVADVSTGDFFNSFIKNTATTYESECPFFRWNVTINGTTIKNKLYEVIGENIGDIKNIKVKKRGSGGIASEILCEGINGTIVLDNQYEIRQVFSPYGYDLKLNDESVRCDMTLLPSAFITVDKVSDAKYKITGGGFGHGSGMSQYGANEMAKAGKKYKEIVTFFYNNVNCGRIDIH